jgi:prevent-host-death family protein
MATFNIHDAKTSFSKLINDVLDGKEVIIAKSGVPIVQLIPYSEEPMPRQGGQLKGVIEISKDFDAPLPKDVLESFYGKAKK